MNRELMIIVERVVRPIQAPMQKKIRMREELYSLIEDTFTEERSAGHNNAEALQRTQARFGNLEELRGELQATIPNLTRIISQCDRWWMRRSRETLFGHALRMGVSMTAAELAAFFVIVPVVAAVFGKPEIYAIWRLLLTLAIVLGVGTFAFMLAGRTAIELFLSEVSLWQRVRKLTVPAGFAGIVAGFCEALMFWSTSWDALLEPGLRASCFSVLLGAGVFLLVCYLFSIEWGQLRPWQSLDLSDS